MGKAIIKNKRSQFLFRGTLTRRQNVVLQGIKGVVEALTQLKGKVEAPQSLKGTVVTIIQLKGAVEALQSLKGTVITITQLKGKVECI